MVLSAEHNPWHLGHTASQISQLRPLSLCSEVEENLDTAICFLTNGSTWHCYGTYMRLRRQHCLGSLTLERISTV